MEAGLFGRNALLMLDSAVHGMPAEAGAFNAGRKMPDTGENGQFAQNILIFFRI